MVRGTTKRTAALRRKGRGPARPRSISATDAEWEEVEQFAARKGFGSTSDGARQLLRSGLRTELLVEEYAAASAWQLAQAWADARAIAEGDRAIGSWDRISAAAKQARIRIRERVAAQRAVRTGT